MADSRGSEYSNSLFFTVAGAQQNDGFLVNTQTVITSTGSTITPYYRGRLGGNFVYSSGTPPVGATDIVILGYFS